MLVLDLVDDLAQRRRERVARNSASPAIQARSACSWRRASRATAAGSSAWRWTSASVCSTESCRCAAKRWRSSSRARSAWSRSAA